MVNQTRNRIQILERCKLWFLYRLYQFSNTYVRNFDRTARGIRRHRRHLVNGTETTTQRSQGRIRKCKTSLYLLPVLVDKVSQIRDNITETLRTSASRPFAARPHCGPDMSAFQPETEHEVRRLLCTMPAKSSPIDVLPCSLLKTCGDVFATAIVKLANWYISVMLQASASSATAENAGLHTLSPENYRPISNLGIISKVIDRLLLARLHPHLLGSRNFGQFQSARILHRKQHSTETALLEVLAYAYAAADDKQVTVLVGLGVSAAFDTVSHDTLLQRLQTEFGVTGTVLSWLRSYLSCRSQFVKLGNHQLPAVSLNVGVPQGSVLGSILFAIFLIWPTGEHS